MKKDIDTLDYFIKRFIPNASEAMESHPSIRTDTEEIKAARERINEIIDQLQGRSLIFRGESKEYDKGKMTSGLYRHYCMPRDGKAPFIDEEHFSTFEEMVCNIEENEKDLSEEASHLDKLINLQYYGGKTAFIDFTLDIHIALYFACNDNPGEDGRLFIFDKFGLDELDNKNFDRECKKTISDQEKIYWINTVTSNVRATFQRSVFLCPKSGYLMAGNYEKDFTIEAKLKVGVLKCLDKFHGINEETIFPDLSGSKRRDGSSYEAFYQGLTLYSRGEYKRAIASYDRVLEINPQDAGVYNNRGIAREALGQYGDAITDFDKALEINPRVADAYNNRGIAREALGQFGEAIKDYGKALEINPQDADAYNNRGVAREALGQFEEAITDFDKALEINPRIAEAYNNRGIAREALGQFEEAITDFDKALEINPRVAAAYSNRGNARRELGQFEEAIKDYGKALEINPRVAAAYHNRGILRRELGKHGDAITDFDKALEINPKSADAYHNRGIAREALRQFEEAIKDYDKALEINPKSADAYNNRGGAKGALGQCEEAIIDFDKALEINQRYAVAYNNRGIAKGKSGQHKEAIKDLEQALELYRQEGNDDRVRAVEEILKQLNKDR